MKLTISHPLNPSVEIKVLDHKFQDIRNYLKLYMEGRKIDSCEFKLEGEAELKKEVVLACLFG